MNLIKEKYRGLLVCLAIAIPAWILGKIFPIIGSAVIAIIAGMVIALFWQPGKTFKPGITFTSKKILQYAVILLGFGLNLNVIFSTGKQSLPIIICTISTSLIIAFALHKAMHIDSNISTLIGVGSSICGGSAIAATAPIIDADDDEVAQAISVIFFFNVLAALIQHPVKPLVYLPALLLMILHQLQLLLLLGTVCGTLELRHLIKPLQLSLQELLQ